jgi:integrase
MAASRTRLTEDALEHVAPGAAVRFIRDDRLTGFALRVTPGGAKSFVVEARVNGRVRRYTIGSAEHVSVSKARQDARTLLASMHKGQDPQRERRAQRERSSHLGAVLDDYLDARRVKASTAEKYRSVLRRTLPDWLDKPIDEITPAMVRVRYETLTKRSVSEANNAMRVLRAVSRRAAIVLPERADGQPALKGIATGALAGAWRTLERRSRVLESREVGPWLRGVDGLRSERSKRALLTLLLTGLRVQEALRLNWRDVHLDARRLVIGDSKTGGFVKVIGPRLAASLSEWRAGRQEGRVFEGVNDLRAALASVEGAGGKAITPHDLRRTFASFAERAGAPFTTLKVLLNHSTRGDVTMGYVRPGEDDLRHWAGVIEAALLAAAEGGEVVRLPVRGSRAS